MVLGNNQGMMLLPIPAALVLAAPYDQDVPLAEYQKNMLAAFQKAGFQAGKGTVVTSAFGKRVEIPLTKAGERFVLTFADIYIQIEQRLPLADAPAAKTLYGPRIKEKFSSVNAEFNAQGVTLSRVRHPVDLTPEYLIEDMLADVQGAAKLISSTSSGTPTPTPSDPLGAALKESGLAFKDIGDFYSLKFDFSSARRSQAAYVRKEVYTSGSLKTRKIISFCYNARNAPSAEILKAVFQKSLGIGGLGLEAP
jgi:hypothetical protein